MERIVTYMSTITLLKSLIRESLADLDTLDTASRNRAIESLIAKGFYLKPRFSQAVNYPHRESSVDSKERKKAIEDLGGKYAYSNRKKEFFWVFEDAQGVESAKKYLKSLIAADDELSRREAEAERGTPGYSSARQADEYFKSIERGETAYDKPGSRSR